MSTRLSPEDLAWEREAECTRSMGEDPCYGCGKPSVVQDINGLDLCEDCAEGCRIPEYDA